MFSPFINIRSKSVHRQYNDTHLLWDCGPQQINQECRP
jgi:hypothetical protein